LRLTVAQEPLQDKSNRIPALKPLLNQLPKGALEGSLISADAMHCQPESARFITQRCPWPIQRSAVAGEYSRALVGQCKRRSLPPRCQPGPRRFANQRSQGGLRHGLLEELALGAF